MSGCIEIQELLRVANDKNEWYTYKTSSVIASANTTEPNGSLYVLESFDRNLQHLCRLTWLRKFCTDYGAMAGIGTKLTQMVIL